MTYIGYLSPHKRIVSYDMHEMEVQSPIIFVIISHNLF
jgi:hypothetical protein